MDETVILYSQDGCMKCKQLKMLLDKNNIEYSTNTSVEEMLSLGFNRTPVLSVGGKHMYLEESERWIINNKEKKHEEQ